MDETVEAISLNLKIPRGMNRKEYHQLLQSVQKNINAISEDEKEQINDALENAEFRMYNNGLTYNQAVIAVSKEMKLNGRQLFIINGSIRLNTLLILRDIMHEAKLVDVSYKECERLKPEFLANHFKLTDDKNFWFKIIWIDSQTYRRTTITNGLDRHSMKYAKEVIVCDKDNNILSSEGILYSARLGDLL